MTIIKQPVIFLMGPTASGKTALAMSLADHFPFQLISVDSALVYRGLDIGTGKPSAEEQRQYPHDLIDICEPNEPFSAADFVSCAVDAIQKAQACNKIPLLVGGTMLYFKALLQGLSPLPKADVLLREQLTAECQKVGSEVMHRQLQTLDPIAAARIHPNDPQRILRALEVNLLTGKAMQTHFEQPKLAFDYPCLQLAIWPERSVLHTRIAQRFHQMLAQGFLEEARSLYQQDWFDPNLPSMRAVGYRQAIEHLSGQLNYDAFIEKSIIATRQLAKRQMTWLKHWISPLHPLADESQLTKDAVQQIGKFLQSAS
jgi:tRNA dimethylallyltransferase